MRRLFSTFADRSASFGLLMLRIVAGTVLILRLLELHRTTPIHTVAIYLIAAGAGLLLLLGSWTAAAGVAVAIIEFFLVFSHTGEPLVNLFLVTVALALALLGAGAWSVDARRFGLKRIEIRRTD